MFNEAYYAIITFMERGGPVLPLIAALTFAMWTMIFERFWFFRTEFKTIVDSTIQEWEGREERRSWSAHAIREAMISQASEKIRGTLPLIQTCVALAPLLGLMGTVTGMVAVFDAMATQGGNARSMASGVSMATIPTMAGMVASLSGVLATTFLQGKVDRETELFEDHLTMDH
ncbi:MAG: MotA/TolQ/ExbB proton channel family protein [Bacteroidetes bacterium]|jgi:biopolymer transport protein ExbB|nr:MotA/TolQ/ExbB proton channel family protein [Gammaproteobacteria bacterium]NBW94523.1 MotA/TolQ/ExbB proton channel family protein [Bacteroidota bacterium]NDA15496.1 MotA/TolQ/ExbB proton channel family protein [Gammaproteobacteria bacterium]NDG45149.1 MotA/TolQ/ExbB proton channel family protein [Gammaproteobacteria bacterium]